MKDRPLKLLGHVHMFPPVHNAGSETTLLAILRGLVKRGHKARVIATEVRESYTVDGIEVLATPRPDHVEEEWKRALYKECDVAITHLNCTGDAMRCAKDTAKPLVHLVHNDNQLRFHNVRQARTQLLIFNSHWVRKKNATDPKLVAEPSMVVHPIVEPEYFRTTPGKHTTFINLTVTKGVLVFYELAKRIPSIQFAGVEGAYGDQVYPGERFHNLTVYEHTPDIRAIFGITKVILMPSDYESYGRVAVEAACSGIPSIVHPTPGLVEALGQAAIYCDRSRVDDWERELRRLYEDEVFYRERSAAALELANSLQPEAELTRVETALRLVKEIGLRGSGSYTVDTLGEERYLAMAKEFGYFDPAREPKTYRPALGDFPMRQKPFVADRKLYLNSQGQVVERSDPDKQVLLIGVNGEIPFARAYELGLVKPDGSYKSFNEPENAQAFAGPLETKATTGEQTTTPNIRLAAPPARGQKRARA